MSTAETIDTGDTVKHGPTGETWTVAYVRDGKLSWCGWPEGLADLADCTLVKAATDDERKKLLQNMALMGVNDARGRYARWRLGQREQQNMGSDPAIGQGGEVAREAGNPKAEFRQGTISAPVSGESRNQPDRSRLTDTPVAAETPTVEQLQELLREVRWYVFHADCPHESAYDDQQAMLKKIDEAAPPLPSHPYVFEQCEKDADCNLGKGDAGDCDEIPF